MTTPAAVNPPLVAPVPAATVDDEFADAFAEAVSADAQATPDTSPDPDPAAEPEPAAEPAEPAPAAEPAAEPPAEPASEPESAAEAPPETPEARIARLEAENAALRQPKPVLAPAAPAAAETAPQAPESAPAGTSEAPAAPPEPAWYQPNDEEKAILSDLEKNWPDIATAQQVAIKQAVYNAVQYTFAQIQKTYNPAIQRFAELSDVISEQLALSALRGEHNDYDEVYDKVVSWVETLPVAFKTGAKQIMAQGTPEEVAELITEYKRVNSVAAPGAAVAPAVPQQRKAELSAAAKQAASKLRVVGSKRTTPVVAADPQDFDAAWNEAVSSGN